MSDLNEDIRFNKPADRLITAIEQEYRFLRGEEITAHNVAEVAHAVINRRLGIDTFTAPKRVKVKEVK